MGRNSPIGFPGVPAAHYFPLAYPDVVDEILLAIDDPGQRWASPTQPNELLSPEHHSPQASTMSIGELKSEVRNGDWAIRDMEDKLTAIGTSHQLPGLEAYMKRRLYLTEQILNLVREQAHLSPAQVCEVSRDDDECGSTAQALKDNLTSIEHEIRQQEIFVVDDSHGFETYLKRRKKISIQIADLMWDRYDHAQRADKAANPSAYGCQADTSDLCDPYAAAQTEYLAERDRLFDEINIEECRHVLYLPNGIVFDRTKDTTLVGLKAHLERLRQARLMRRPELTPESSDKGGPMDLMQQCIASPRRLAQGANAPTGVSTSGRAPRRMGNKAAKTKATRQQSSMARDSRRSRSEAVRGQKPQQTRRSEPERLEIKKPVQKPQPGRYKGEIPSRCQKHPPRQRPSRTGRRTKLPGTAGDTALGRALRRSERIRLKPPVKYYT